MSFFDLRKDIKIYTSKDYDLIIKESYNFLSEIKTIENKKKWYDFVSLLNKYKKNNMPKAEHEYLIPINIKLEKRSVIFNNSMWNITVIPKEITSDKLYQKIYKHLDTITGLTIISENKDFHTIPISDFLQPEGVTRKVKIPSKIIEELIEGMNPLNRMRLYFLNSDSSLSRLVGKNVKSASQFASNKQEYIIAIYLLYGITIEKSTSEIFFKTLVEGLPLTDFGITVVEDARNFLELVDLVISSIKLAKESNIYRNNIFIGNHRQIQYEHEDSYLERAEELIKKLDGIINKNNGEKINRSNLKDFYFKFFK